MGTQLHAQKQYPATHIETPKVSKPHQFAVQTSVDTASQPKQRAVDWQTELSGAKRFGHNLSRVQLHSHPPTQRQVPISQRRAYLQASLVDEEQKQDKQASRTQRKSEGERDSLLARLAQPALTSPNSVAERSPNTNTNHRSIKESAMSTQEHIQKKPSATTPAPRLHNGFETPGFSVQTKSDKASPQQSGNLKTQLSRATRFGHNLSKMSAPTSSSPVAALQTKAPASGLGNQPLQRQEEPEEEPEQMKAARPLQRQEEPEEEPEQMKAARPLQRQEEPEEEPEQMKAAQPLQRQEEPEEEPEQMKAAQPAQHSIQRKAAQKPSSGSGSSMPGGVRAKMEKSFGTNFSNVSIHTDSVQAKSIGALAYTQGSNVHFAPGQYNPQSQSGQALLGHELTHVVQQRAGRVPVPQQSKGGAPINADPALEKEADEMGAKAAQGKLARVPGAARPMATIASPIQNSTEPVQFFLPMLMGALGGPAGIAGMLGPLLGGGAPGGAPAGGGGFDPLGGIMGAVGGGLGGLMSGNPMAALTGAVGGGLGGMMGGAPAGGAPAGGGGLDPLGGIMGAVGGGLGGLMSGGPMGALTGAVGGAPAGGMMGGAPAGGMMGGAPAGGMMGGAPAAPGPMPGAAPAGGAPAAPRPMPGAAPAGGAPAAPRPMPGAAPAGGGAAAPRRR